MKKTLSFLGATLLAFATLTPAAQATEFKPGNRGFGVDVPADTLMAGTSDPHPCADRKLAYHSHVDAIYATRLDGELQTMIVDGQVPIPAEQLCLRLAPDANKNGDEISRLVVPFDDPKLSFLGDPGDIVWVAPQEVDFMDSWRPLWAGAGAFDPHHELSVPSDFVDNKVTMELAEIDGPGDVEMFFYNRSADEPNRVFSTKDDKRTFQLNVGSHGHYSWTFTEAGIYNLTWRVHGQKTDGTEETGPLVTTTWLVGSDEEVGLPEGTTTELAPITKSAEDMRDEMTEAANPTTSAPAETPAEVYTQSTEQVQKLLWRSNPTTMITHGHQDMGLFGSGREAVAKMHSDVDGDHRSTTFVYAVPNRALLQIPAPVSQNIGVCAGWVLPQTQDFSLPWPGFSTENFDYNSVTPEGIAVSISAFEGPGRMVATHDALLSTSISLDSADLSLKVHYPQRSHDHMAFTFTQPGAYRVTYAFEGKTTEGQPLYKELVAYYMVGDSALYDAAIHMGIDPASLKLTEPATRDTTPKCGPVTEEPAAEPTAEPTEEPNEESTSAPASEVEPTTEVMPTTDVAPPTTEVTPTTPNADEDHSRNGLQELGLAIGIGTSALGIASHLLKHDDDAKSTKPGASSPAQTREKKDTSSQPAPVNEPGAASGGKSGATAGGTSSGKSGGTSGGAINSAKSGGAPKSTATPTPTGTATPTATAEPMPALQAAPVPVAPPQEPQVTNAAATGGLTSGGWLAGFIIGIGVMALLGGLGLFIATARALRQLGGRSQKD